MSYLLCGDDNSVLRGHIWREMCPHDLDHTFEVLPGLAGIICDGNFLRVHQWTVNGEFFSNKTHMLIKSFDLLARSGEVEELIGWRRDRPNSLHMEQPTEVPNNNPRAFQSLMNTISWGTFYDGGRGTDLEVGGPRPKLRDKNVHAFNLLCFVARVFDVDNDATASLHSRDNRLPPPRVQSKAGRKEHTLPSPDIDTLCGFPQVLRNLAVLRGP